MVTWLSQPQVGPRRCDAPGCPKESLPGHCVVARPAIGPALDRPLRLFFCEEHGDVEALFQRYLAQRTARGRTASPVQR